MSWTESPQREAVKNLYPGAGWQNKVKVMTDKQIIAIYLRLKAEGKVN